MFERWLIESRAQVQFLHVSVAGATAVSGGGSVCARCLTVLAFVLVALTLPFSLLLCIKARLPTPRLFLSSPALTYTIPPPSRALSCALQVTQEYERAVIFRLGRLRGGNAKGPGAYLQCSLSTVHESVRDVRRVERAQCSILRCAGLFFVLPCIETYTKVRALILVCRTF